MKRTTKYVALDVHQAMTVASVREESGRILARSIFPTEEQAVLEFFRGMRGSIHVTFEEGTQAQWLYDLLVPVVDRVLVCDRRGGLRAVYHGSPHRSTLRELTRTYQNVVEDSTRVMLRLKAMFRARGIKTPGRRVYHPKDREEWLAKLDDDGVRLRAQTLYAQLDVLRELRPKVKATMVAEARRDPAWAVLGSLPFLGPVRIALILAIMRTPWRFRTKRNLWAYCGLAVVTHSSSDYEMVDSQVVRRRRAPMTRGLNRNCNRELKDVFKGAATAATGRPGPLLDYYEGMVARGMREELARVTLTRKLAALTLRLWKKGEHYDPAKLTKQAR